MRTDLYNLNLRSNVKSISEMTFRTDKYSLHPFKAEFGRKQDDSNEDNTIIFNSNGYIIEQNKYKYDILLAEGHNYTLDDFHSEKWIFMYDDFNKKIEKIVTDKYLKSIRKEVFIYDTNKIIVKHFNEDFHYATIENLLDEYGRIVTKKTFEEGDFIGYRNFQYNSTHDLIKEVREEWAETTNFKYDEKRNLIEVEKLEDNKVCSTTIFKYKYDAFENWIERVEFKNDKPIYITERKIEYYN